MKKAIFICSFLLITQLTFAQSTTCERVTNFGTSEICLRKIAGYQESYSEPKIKALADGTETPANMVLGFYLNNEVYEKREAIGTFEFDDYFKVYATKALQNVDASKDLLKTLEQELATSFISKNWDKIKDEVDQVLTGVEVGKPTLVKSYNLTDNSITCILLIKYGVDGESTLKALTMNALLVKNRLIWMAYYLNYQDNGTIDTLEENSNKIMKELLDAND